MPVYNVEDYLAETIDSILSQTMDFEQNCEIILINDGSPDNSEAICLQYQEKYPDNIKYIKQKNQGVSAARNRGVQDVEGKYISFLDSDDKISRNTLKQVFEFFERHYDEIDIASIRLVFFDAQTGNHMLNYKFNESRVVYIEKEHESIQLSGGSIFVKSDVLKAGGIYFDQTLKYAEDMKLVNELILEKLAYGVVAEPVYLYRKRQGAGSALSNTINDKSWYFDVPKKVHQHLFELAKEKYDHVPRYIQFLVMYDLQWKYKQASKSLLTEQEIVKFRSFLSGLLQYIDDDIIMTQRNIWPEFKLFILSEKYGRSILDNAKRKGTRYYYEKTLLYDYAETKPEVNIEILEYKGEKIHIEGYVKGVIFPDARLQFAVGDITYQLQPMSRPLRRQYFFDELVAPGNGFSVDLAVEYGMDIVTELIIDGARYGASVNFKRFSYMSNLSRNAYRVLGPYLVKREQDGLSLKKYSVLHHILHEVLYLLALSIRLKMAFVWQAMEQVRQGDKSKRKLVLLTPIRSIGRNIMAALIRLSYYCYKPFAHSNIWLISDRIAAAGDNGEALFRYIAKRPNDKLKPYFAISRSSPDYKRMKAYGRVINRGGFHYKMLFLHSNKVISSHADDFVINPFGAIWPDLIDLYNFDYVFLQHGITKDDISGWLNKYNKNIKLFVAAGKSEYESLLNDSYGYSKKEVRLTGFPRYDLLKNEPKNKLILAPTWRQGLAGATDSKTGLRDYSDLFKGTEYFKFYQSLMEDARIVKALNKYDMTGELYLHPALSSQIADFKGGSRFHIKNTPYDYKTAFQEGNILVTDYSSVFFDFAYLKKPVVYTQFDHDEFFQGHLYEKGYFSYQDDGFGPVAGDYEAAVQCIIDLLESGCKIQKNYEERVKKFFFKFDQNNSKRVYEAILKIPPRLSSNGGSNE